MHARQTTVKATPDKVDAAIDAVREAVLPALRSADGFKGFTLLADRGQGTLVGISFFETRDQLEASEQAVQGPREDTARKAGADDVDVQLFEVVIDEEAS